MARKSAEVSACLVALACGAMAPSTAGIQAAGEAEEEVLTLSLAECIEIALANNDERKASESDLRVSEALRGQARSSYWPTITGEILATRMDADPLFRYPATLVPVPAIDVPIPSMEVTIPSTSITLPARTIRGRFPQNDISVYTSPVTIQTPSSTIGTPPQELEVPEQDIKMMDRDNLLASLGVMLPLYTGGKRSAIVGQAQAGVAAAQAALRNTEHQVVYEVRRLYYASVLARQLVQITDDTVARLDATLALTEQVYQGGSGTVTKTDFLRNKSMVDGARTMQFRVQSAEKLARDALVFYLGLAWDRRVEPEDTEIPFELFAIDFPALLDEAYASNPVILRLEAGIRAARAKVREAKSGHIPKVAMVGNLSHIENKLDTGIMPPENKDTWMIGIGVEVPVFSGGLTRNEVREACARLCTLEHQRRRLHEGIALKVKEAVYDVERSRAQKESAAEALDSAVENRELNIRAYHEQLVETEDVLRAQLTEAVLDSLYRKTLYDHAEAKARLDLVVGRSIPGGSPPGPQGADAGHPAHVALR